MYAIVSIAGQQFKVAKDQQIFVHRLQGDEGANIEFDNVLLAENEGKFKLGADLKSAKVSAKIVSHLKGDKVIIFKRKEEKVTKRRTVTVNNLPRSRSLVSLYNQIFKTKLFSFIKI